MNPEQIKQTLQHIATEKLGWTKPLPEGELAESLDSVDRLALVVAIEDHFQLAFEPEDDEAVRTLDDVVRVIFERQRG